MSLRIVAAETPNAWRSTIDLRADGLARGDVVLHDRAEHRETAFGDHVPRFPHRLALVLIECQSYRDIPGLGRCHPSTAALPYG